MTNYKFDTYRGNKSGEIVLECKYEQLAINKIKKMNITKLRESVDNEVVTDVRVEENLIVFYNGELIRKI